MREHAHCGRAHSLVLRFLRPLVRPRTRVRVAQNDSMRRTRSRRQSAQGTHCRPVSILDESVQLFSSLPARAGDPVLPSVWLTRKWAEHAAVAMTRTETSADVFISYADEDRVVVEKLIKALNVRGREVPWREPTSTDWVRKIERALSSARFALLVLSPASFSNSVASREMELLYGREQIGPRFRIIPILARWTEPPGFLQGRPFLDAKSLPMVELARRIDAAIETGDLETSRTFAGMTPEEYSRRLRRIREETVREHRAADIRTPNRVR
jgi:hypothetical protein